MSLTPTVLTDCRIYLAGADLTGYSNKIATKAEVVQLDKTTFGSAGWRERGGGLWDMSSSIDGFWQAGGADQPDDVLWASLGVATVPYTVVPAAGTVGSLAYLSRAISTAYQPMGEVGQYLAWSADLAGNWPFARGQILHPAGTARTVTGTGTGVQLGAVGAAQRMYSCLHVQAVSGTTPQLTVKIQSDTSNAFASPVDRIVFSTATGISGQTGSVDGAVTHTWWRAVWTIAGTTPSFQFAVSAGVAAK